ncbi:hypothetical protein PQI07_08040 [Methylobacterium sp. 092160098-2]|uniref:hypothetical protein n=1 Tax=Methylobacterium sp. 092160098-2 TaxID=3025129 RepID=UPI002381ACC3|nr:hypothetical protein [Methylobacterium sp. 092160098-2]MDE4910654.1 hypothetical protein [Methylobacterium sp. 092160098-2]
MNAAFWAELDARIARAEPAPATADGNPAVAGPLPVAASGAGPETPSEPPSRPDADWSQVLDTLSAASIAAQEQDQRLRQRSATCETLSAELQAARQEIEALRAHLQEVQTQAALRVREVEALADGRVRDADERAEAAIVRAESAEDWLKRIEQASRDLLPDGRHAAA